MTTSLHLGPSRLRRALLALAALSVVGALASCLDATVYPPYVPDTGSAVDETTVVDSGAASPNDATTASEGGDQ
jgi:hypothetical protein